MFIILLNYHFLLKLGANLFLDGNFFQFSMVFVGSGSNPTFDTDPDPGK